jgi:hypothetical protein
MKGKLLRLHISLYFYTSGDHTSSFSEFFLKTETTIWGHGMQQNSGPSPLRLLVQIRPLIPTLSHTLSFFFSKQDFM